MQDSTSSMSGPEPINPIDDDKYMHPHEAIWKQFREQVSSIYNTCTLQMLHVIR